jgi:O-antigen/teichoic acid export membrane protein
MPRPSSVAASSETSGTPPGPPAVPKQAFSLTLSSGAVFAVALVIQIVGFIGSTLFLAKHVGITEQGQALIGTAQLFLLISSSINGIGDLRLGTAYTYFLARGKSAKDNTTTYLVVRMGMVAVSGLILFVIAPLSLGGRTLVSDPALLSSFGVFMVLPVVWSFSTVYNQLFVGQGNSLKAQYPGLVESIVRLPFLIYVTYYNPTVPAITGAYAIGAVASMVYSLPAILAQRGQFRSREATHLFHFAWPLMASLLLNYVVTNMVPLIVAAGLGSAALSQFLIANGFRILVLSLPAAVTTPLFPYLAGLHQQERYDALRRGTWQALRYSAMLLVPGVVALVTYRYNFLNVLGNRSYAIPASLPLAILVIGALPLALSQIIQSSINAIGRQRLELYITSTQIIVLFAGVYLIMPPWAPFPIYPGLVAGSLAILASSVAAFALNTYFMETLIRVHIYPRSILAIVGSAAGSFFALWLINHTHFFPVSTWYELLTAVLTGFVVYFVVLALVGELTRDDVYRISSSVGLPRWLYHAVGRICWRIESPDVAPIDLATAPGLRPVALPETFTGTPERPTVPSPGEIPPEETSDAEE